MHYKRAKIINRAAATELFVAEFCTIVVFVVAFVENDVVVVVVLVVDVIVVLFKHSSNSLDFLELEPTQQYFITWSIVDIDSSSLQLSV